MLPGIPADIAVRIKPAPLPADPRSFGAATLRPETNSTGAVEVVGTVVNGGGNYTGMYAHHTAYSGSAFSMSIPTGAANSQQLFAPLMLPINGGCLSPGTVYLNTGGVGNSYSFFVVFDYCNANGPQLVAGAQIDDPRDTSHVFRNNYLFTNQDNLQVYATLVYTPDATPSASSTWYVFLYNKNSGQYNVVFQKTGRTATTYGYDVFESAYQAGPCPVGMPTLAADFTYLYSATNGFELVAPAMRATTSVIVPPSAATPCFAADANAFSVPVGNYFWKVQPSTNAPAVGYMNGSFQTYSGLLNANQSARLVAISTAVVPSANAGSGIARNSITASLTGGTYGSSGPRSVLDASQRVMQLNVPGMPSDLPPEQVDTFLPKITRSLQVQPEFIGRHELRKQSLPTAQGATANLWVSNGAIGNIGGGSFNSVPATLQLVTAHGYIWIDNALSAMTQASIAAIGANFENAWASDNSHFGTPDWPFNAPAMVYGGSPCDSTGASLGPPVIQEFIPDPAQHHHVFVVAQASAGAGVGGYFFSVNNIVQGILNCIEPGAKSNEASMIVLVWPSFGFTSLNFELNEDTVRGTAHEFQHLINFVNHCMLNGTQQAPNCQSEDSYINEGLSMLAQDLALPRLFPSLTHDLGDAVFHGNVYMAKPQNFSLTGFTGIDAGTLSSGTPTFNCSGCYGAAFLFQRYLYDRFGGDTYTRGMESGGDVSAANLEENTANLQLSATIGDFAIALMGTNYGADPRFNLTSLPPGSAYTDQFGNSTTFNALTPIGALSPGSSSTVSNALAGSFLYFSATPGAAAHTAQVTDNSGTGAFKITGGVAQH